LWARSRVRETETKLVWKQGFSRRIFVLKLLGEKMVALSQLFPTRAPQLSDDLSSGQCSKSGYGVAVVDAVVVVAKQVNGQPSSKNDAQVEF